MLTAMNPLPQVSPTGWRRGFRNSPVSPVKFAMMAARASFTICADPLQWNNLWMIQSTALKSDLVADLYDSLPDERAQKLKVEAPA